MKFRCPKCGEIIEEGVTPCPGCGQPFKWPDKPAETPSSGDDVDRLAADLDVAADSDVASEGAIEDVAESAEESTEEDGSKDPDAPKKKKIKIDWKKHKKTIIIGAAAVVLIIVLLIVILSIVNARSYKKRIVGTWESEQVSLLDELSAEVSPDDKFFKYVNIEYDKVKESFPVMVYYNVVFDSDGTFKILLSSKDFELAAQNVAKGIYNAYYNGLKDYFVLNNIDKSKITGFLADCGFTEDYFESKFRKNWEPGMVIKKGTWSIGDDKKLYINIDNETVKYSISFDGKTVTIPELIATGKFTKQ